MQMHRCLAPTYRAPLLLCHLLSRSTQPLPTAYISHRTYVHHTLYETRAITLPSFPTPHRTLSLSTLAITSLGILCPYHSIHPSRPALVQSGKRCMVSLRTHAYLVHCTLCWSSHANATVSAIYTEHERSGGGRAGGGAEAGWQRYVAVAARYLQPSAFAKSATKRRNSGERPERAVSVFSNLYLQLYGCSMLHLLNLRNVRKWAHPSSHYLCRFAMWWERWKEGCKEVYHEGVEEVVEGSYKELAGPPLTTVMGRR